MMPSKLSPIRAVVPALALFSLISCILDGDRTAKRGSEVENELHGILVALDGKPVQGAKVKAVPAAPKVAKRGGTSAADSDSVVTDEEGRYAFRGLESGRYNLFGDYQNGALVVLIPDVDRSDTGKELDLGTDTLRAPGRIRGRVLLGDSGKEGVLAYVPGTSYLAVSDDSGRFVISGVPQGTHAVRYSATGFVIEPDVEVRVLSGQTTDLPVKRLAHDPALPPPAPTGLRAVYDTLNERVTLTWDTVRVSDLDGYVIYRDESSMPDQAVAKVGFVTGTTFMDSGFPKPAGDGKISLVYRIKSRDQELNHSLSFSSPETVDAVSKDLVTTRIETSTPPLHGGVVSIKDSLTLSVAYRNPTRRIIKVSWQVHGHPDSLQSKVESTLSGTDSLRWMAGDEPGTSLVQVRITDEAGVVRTAEFGITVVQDPPQAMAGPDTTVSPGDTVRLRGKGTDTHGRISMMEWSCDDAEGFRRSETGNATWVAPSFDPRVWSCVLRVTDDDGNSASDTLRVNLVRDLPKASAGEDFAVSIGDSVHLQGSGSDGFGRIVKWEWDIGGQGAFVTSRDGEASFRAGTAPEVVVCWLRVTDDDGNHSLDTVRVLILEDPPVAEAGTDRTATLHDRITLVGTGKDGLGKITSFEWDLGGTGVFENSPDGRIEVALPSSPHPAFPAILRVTDDDGKQDLDTVLVAVLQDSPLAVAAADSGEFFEGDSVRLKAHGSRDGLGKLVTLEWRVGEAGVFTTAGMDTTVVLPPGAGPVRCILRVTDDDGLSALDTVEIKAHERGLKAWIQSTAELLGPGLIFSSTCNAVVFRDRMWLIGQAGGSIGSTYHSVDGKTWAPGASRAFDPVPANSTVVFKDRIWVFSNSSAPDTTSGRIWSSGDGITWSRNQDLPAYGARCRMVMTVFKNRIWLFGGWLAASGSRFNDIWSSEDGLTWVKSTPALPFTPLTDSYRTLVHGDRIFMFQKFAAKVWSSEDGENWTQLTDTPPYLMDERTPISYEGRIWGVGGGWDSVYPPVAHSSDGLAWSTIMSDPAFGPRSDPLVLSFRGRIWAIGGHTPSWSTIGSHPRGVWYSK